MEPSPPLEERGAQDVGQAAQAILADFSTLRAGIVTARVATATRLPTVLESLMRISDMAQAGTVTLDSTIDQLAGSLAELSTALEGIDVRVSELATLVSADVLTGVLNRAALDRRLRRAAAEAASKGWPLAVMFCDIDHFKEFNDRFGHHVGDHVLRLVANALNAYPDGRRIVGRYGGEEFVLVMPGRTATETLFVAQTVASALAARVLRMRGTGEPLGSITLSGGVAEWRPPESAADLLRRADAAMYRAKRAGRNRVVLAD